MEKLYVGGDILSELETQISIYHSKLIKNICYDVFKDPSLIPGMLSKYTIKHTQSNCQVAPDKPNMERHNNLLNQNPDTEINDECTANDIIITNKKPATEIQALIFYLPIHQTKTSLIDL